MPQPSRRHSEYTWAAAPQPVGDSGQVVGWTTSQVAGPPSTGVSQW